MAKWIPDSYLDFILNEIKKSDGESVCSSQPLTYFNAIKPALHVLSTAYSVGDCVRPPTANGKIYECTIAGTSGSVEPGWGSTQDQTFVDGGVTWKTHNNYSLAYVDLAPADIVLSDATSGRKLVIAEKQNVITHATGTVTHTAFVENAAKKLHLVTTSETTLPADDYVESGRTTIFYSITISVEDPV